MLEKRSAGTGRWIRVLAAGAAIFLGSIAAQAQTTVRFSLNWRWNGVTAPFALALERGGFAAEGLNVIIEPAASSMEAITRVASGEADAGVADMGALVRFRDENDEAGVKAVMMIQDRAPHAIVGRRSRGVTEDLASLQGKTFGAPETGDAYGMWPLFKTINKIDDSSMEFENVGFPVREPMLAQGDVDAVFGSAAVSYINLASRGVPGDDIVVLPMRDYGLDAYGDAVIVSETFAQENPEAVRGLLQAITRAIQDTIRDPGGAIEAVLKYSDGVEEEVELERLNMVLDRYVATEWVEENGIGGIDRERFASFLEQIGQTLDDSESIKAEGIFTDDFLPPADQRKLTSSSGMTVAP